MGDAALTKRNEAPQRYVLGLYRFLNEVFDCSQPTVVFCYAVAGAPAVAMAEVCKRRHVPFCRLVGTRIGAGHIVDDDPLGRFAPVGRRLAAVRAGTMTLKDEHQKAQKYLCTFRQAPRPPEYAQYNHSRASRQKFVVWTAKKLPSIAFEFVRQLIMRGGYGRMSFKNSVFKITSTWRRDVAARSLGIHWDSLPEDFVYYPLHVDPEASTMVLSPWHTDEVSIIEALAKSLPANLSLSVKEHVPMLGKRPPGFYEIIIKMPRVVMVKPFVDSLTLVERAQLTAIITGTAAWEALCLKRPTLIIGESPFLAVGEGFVYEPCLACLPEAIRSALSTKPASDEALEIFIAACLGESFEMPNALLWGKNYDSHSLSTRIEVVGNIVDGIDRGIQELFYF